MVILGIDPGLNVTGYGAIRALSGSLAFLEAGDIRPARGRPMAERLQTLHQAMEALVARLKPDALVLEMVFTHQRYVATAARMAHARGVVCLAAQQHHVVLIEYPPARVKQAVTGHGAATKEQMAKMVAQRIGRCDPAWSFDATDALALAIAHSQMCSSIPVSAR